MNSGFIAKYINKQACDTVYYPAFSDENSPGYNEQNEVAGNNKADDEDAAVAHTCFVEVLMHLGPVIQL